MGKKSPCRLRWLLLCLMICLDTALRPLTVCAAPANIKEQNMAANQAIPIESNDIVNWPQGPVVSAHSAILIEADTGTILYEKNIHAREYPASTTKILTTLIAAEKCSLNETVSFSHDAVFGIPRDSNHVSMNVGDTLTMEQCLQAILIRSANEVSYAVAEHISGSWDEFADLMNQRAAELGCVDSHFVNPNGLPDDEHYTSAHDLAQIGRAFFANELLSQITKMPYLRLSKSNGDLVDANQMELLPGKKYAYEYLVGCKTGYTNDARNSLVSCAERDGMRLICVVLRDENPAHYEDTIALFNYGFSNFEKVNISQAETKYNIENAGFYSENDIFGSSRPILQLNQNDCAIVPKTVDFKDLDSVISYASADEDTSHVATIRYSYRGVFVGSATVDLAGDSKSGYSFTAIDEDAEAAKKPRLPAVIFINILKVLLWIIGIAAAIMALLVLYRSYRIYNRRHPNNRRNWKRDRRKQHSFTQSPRSAQLARRREALKQQRRHKRKSRRSIRSALIEFLDGKNPDF